MERNLERLGYSITHLKPSHSSINQMIKAQNHNMLISFTAIAILCFLLALILESKLLFLVPFGGLLLYVSVLDYRFLYLLLFACIPFSIEFYLPNGLGLDLPTEPIMLMLTGIGILLFLSRMKSIDSAYLKQPILWLMILHIIWILFTSITSVDQIVSFKFFLAKLWYVIPFYFMSLHLFSQNKYIYQWIKILSIAIVLVLIYTNIRHAGHGFSFEKMNKSVAPFFRNHVNYAALLAIMLPFVWAIYQKTKSKWYILIMVFMGISVYLSYTRAAYVTVMMLPFVYFAVKYRLLRPAVWLGFISIPFLIVFFVKQNNYLNYAPDYEKTIMNYDFDDLLTATYKMEDLSTMERVYRWVAGGRMIGDHPILGFGPSTFYRTYRGYVVTDFQTYVSDNPEKSGIHNYFLMTTVEQGIIGLIIFLALLIMSLLIAQRLYLNTTNKQDKEIIMATIMSLVSIIAILLINDMLETDKLGPFFFVNLAILTHYDVKARNDVKTRTLR